MPVIHFYGNEMTKEKKAELGEKLTKAAHEVFPFIPEEGFVVVINELSLDNFSVGGKLVSDRLAKESK
jgi:4-oxalocrotonate tautomerase family enzyme